MRRLHETFCCLVVLCCVSSLHCRVLKLVVAVSPLAAADATPPSPSVRANKIYPTAALLNFIRESLRIVWRVTPLYVCRRLRGDPLPLRELVHLHIYVTEDYWEPPTVPSVSPPDITTLSINLFAYLSSTLEQNTLGITSKGSYSM